MARQVNEDSTPECLQKHRSIEKKQKQAETRGVRRSIDKDRKKELFCLVIYLKHLKIRVFLEIRDLGGTVEA